MVRKGNGGHWQVIGCRLCRHRDRCRAAQFGCCGIASTRPKATTGCTYSRLINGPSRPRSKSTAVALADLAVVDTRSPNWPTAPRPRSASPEASAGSEIPVRRPEFGRKGRGLSLFIGSPERLRSILHAAPALYLVRIQWRPFGVEALPELSRRLRAAVIGVYSAGDPPLWIWCACTIWARNCVLTERLKELGRLPAEERRSAGQAINEAKQP